MKPNSFLFSVSCLFLSLSAALAQTTSSSVPSSKPEPDYQFRKILDETGLPNTIDADGDFKLTLNRENGRSQVVYAYSNTSTFKNILTREIVSNAHV